MKATKIISACAVLVALASCSNDHVISQPGAEDTPIRIQANVGAVTTKAASDIQGSQFVNGESVNVYIYEHTTGGPATYTYGNGGNGLVTCTSDGAGKLNPGSIFYPQNGNGIDVYGVYPTSVTENQSQFSVNTDQSQDANYKASDLMYASCQTDHRKGSDVNLTFVHKLSKVTVELIPGTGFQDTDLDNAVVNIMNTYTACSIASLDKSGIGSITASAIPSDIKPVKIGTWSNSTKAKMSAIVIPQTINAGDQLFEVTLDGISTPYKYKIPIGGNNVVFAEGKEYNYKLTIKIDGIGVTSSINNWTDDSSSLPDNGNGDAKLD